MQASKEARRSMLLTAIFAMSLCTTRVAIGQAPRMLPEDDVTPAVLIELLRLDKNRNIKVRPTGESAMPGAAAEAAESVRPTASLLITFRTNSTVLAGSARRTLDAVATALKSTELGGSKFLIEGHADPRGNAEANLRLSEGRAAEVRRYLVDVHHLPPRRLNSIGKGDRELMNSIDIAAPENRRVTIVNVSN